MHGVGLRKIPGRERFCEVVAQIGGVVPAGSKPAGTTLHSLIFAGQGVFLVFAKGGRLIGICATFVLIYRLIPLLGARTDALD